MVRYLCPHGTLNNEQKWVSISIPIKFPHIVPTVQPCLGLPSWAVLLFFPPSSPQLLRGSSRTASLIMRKSLWTTMTIIGLYAMVYLAVSRRHLRSFIQVLCFLSFSVKSCPYVDPQIQSNLRKICLITSTRAHRYPRALCGLAQ